MRQVSLAFALSWCLGTLEAQTPGDVVITGHVIGPQRAPIEHAMLRVTTPAGVLVAVARSDSAGAVRLRVADPGTELKIVVTAIGYAPDTTVVARDAVATGAVDLGTMSLRQLSIELPVTRVVERPRPRPSLMTSSERQFTGGTSAQTISLSSLSGSDDGDLMANLAMLPGVTLSGGGFSVLGLDPEQNSIQLGGLPFTGLSVPRDLFGTITLTMASADAAVSGFSGARLAISPGAAAGKDARMRVTLDPRPLHWNRRAGLPGADYSNIQISGVATGGSSRRIYSASWQMGQRSSRVPTLSAAGPAALALVGLHPDSAARVVDIAESLGFEVERRAGASMHRKASALAAVFNYPSSERSITTIGGVSLDVDEGPSSGPFDLGARTMMSRRLSGLLSLRYSRYFRDAIFHSQQLGLSVRNFGGTSERVMPVAAIDVASTDGSAATGITRLTLGTAVPGSPEGTDWDAQLVDEMNWLSRNGRQSFRTRGYVQLSGFRNTPASPPPTFVFQSPAELAAGRAARYTRAFAVPTANRLLTTNLSFTTSWTRREELVITGGVAVEGARYLGASPPVQAVVDRFRLGGVGTPSALTLSPRLGVTWSFGRIAPRMLDRPSAALESRFTLGGTLGSYRASLGAHTLDAAIASAQTPRVIDCIGAAAPMPDWGAYRSGAADAPDACVDGSAPLLATSVPSIVLFERRYVPPVSNRLNAFFAMKTSATTNARVEVVRSWNWNQSSRSDRNLVSTPRFRIAAEAGRPSFADPQAIVPATGIVGPASARLDSMYGRVFVQGAALRSSSIQLTGRLTRTSPLGTWSATLIYNLLMGREQANGWRGTTAGNPRDIEWQPLAGNGQHSWALQLHWNFRGTNLLLFGRAASGGRYTPRVAGDVNGDGAANDRAFVFDPATPGDTAVARGMSDLLRNAPSEARHCLESQIGRIAAPNSCRGPWTATLNARVQFPPRLFTATERFGVALSFTNLLAGADLLLHGSARAHGWGQSAVPDATLLTVRGFDASASRFTYVVNPRFGSTRSQLAAFWNPARVALDVQANVWPNPRRRRIELLLRAGRANDLRASEGDILRMLVGAGPTALALASGRNLPLSPAQRDSVQAIRTTLLAEEHAAFAPLARYLAQLPDGFLTREVEARIRSEIEASAKRYASAVAAMRELMSKEQIEQVALYLRRELDPANVYDKRMRSWY